VCKTCMAIFRGSNSLAILLIVTAANLVFQKKAPEAAKEAAEPGKICPARCASTVVRQTSVASARNSVGVKLGHLLDHQRLGGGIAGQLGPHPQIAGHSAIHTDEI
jgi:hypothetical protein